MTEVTFCNDVTLIKWPALINFGELYRFWLLGGKLNYSRTSIVFSFLAGFVSRANIDKYVASYSSPQLKNYRDIIGLHNVTAACIKFETHVDQLITWSCEVSRYCML